MSGLKPSFLEKKRDLLEAGAIKTRNLDPPRSSTSVFREEEEEEKEEKEKAPEITWRTPSPEAFGGTSTPISRPPAVENMTSASNLNATHIRSGSSGADTAGSGSTENVSMQKRLVEQFYKMEGKTPRQSDTVPSALKGAFSASLTDLSRDTRPGSVGGIGSNNISGTGGIGIGSKTPADSVIVAPFDEGVLAVQDTVPSLLSVGGFSAENELEKLAQVLAQTIASFEREPRLEDAVPSGQQQLENVQQNLQKVRLSVDEMAASLSETAGDAKHQYHEETQRSVAKVTRLGELLTSLSARVDSAKANMAENRDLLETQIANKIKVLEHVAARFDAYDHEIRGRRVRQAVAAAAVLAVLLAVYLGLRG